MPRASDAPSFDLGFNIVPCPNNDLGREGRRRGRRLRRAAGHRLGDLRCAGASGHIDMPVTPEKVWRVLAGRGGAAGGMSQNFIPAAFIRGGSSKGVVLPRARTCPRARGDRPDTARACSAARTRTAGSSTAWAAASPPCPRASSSARRRTPRPMWTTPSPRWRWTGRWSTGRAIAATCPPPSALSRWMRAWCAWRMARRWSASTRSIPGSSSMPAFRCARAGARSAAISPSPGVAGTGARIRLDFLSPGGSQSAGLLPTGNVVDTLEVPGFGPLRATPGRCRQPGGLRRCARPRPDRRRIARMRSRPAPT